MALSPSVEVHEKDRTLNVNNIVSNGTAYVGMFTWGPVEELTTITTNERELVDTFGKPSTDTSIFFHSALNYLLYVNPLTIVRVVGDNAKNAVGGSQSAMLVKNLDQYDQTTITDTAFIARYPGTLANNIEISAADSSGFAGWTFEDQFDYEPDTDRFHLVVVDGSGEITGQAGNILETYSDLSKTPGTKKANGGSAYVKKVIRDQSRWILYGDESTFDLTTGGTFDDTLLSGVDDNDPSTADFTVGWELCKASDVTDLFRFFTAGNPDDGITKAIDVADSRQDVVCFAATSLDSVLHTTGTEDLVIDYITTTINKNSSYVFYVDNWKQVYDKYNDDYVWIPTDSDAAALHARTFAQNEPWFSPAGLNRGQLKNVVKLAWNANKDQRDALYKKSINSIISLPGEGVVLWGDKTGLRKPSAFNRINVRSLFIVLKKNISQSARYQLFEFNDFITRNTFTRAVTRHLDDVQARRGVTKFLVVADESNNTPQVIDSNSFVGDIYVSPNRSINFITLNFIATPSGIDFTEIEG